MGPSQFGSRIGICTFDAMQCYLRWKEHAHFLGHFVTFISADVKGGFDKVDPSRLTQTHLNPYTPTGYATGHQTGSCNSAPTTALTPANISPTKGSLKGPPYLLFYSELILNP